MQKEPSADKCSTDDDLEQLKTLILGHNDARITERVEREARATVTDVVSEALHDRENKDGSVKHVIQPLVEDAVQQSVAQNSERLVSSLYPIVGSLVRKSVTAFLNDFMEKTNQLLENSLTIKGLTWRFKAWQSGISFAQYAASQTFTYRVEHVFLIHKNTGLLLNSVTLNINENSDADVISSMLTAINDFVGDSFIAEKDKLKEQLQLVSTENFNLMIKPGPNALVVAAITGTPPQHVSDQLQLTLENIQQLYYEELTLFDGDNSAFTNAENSLRECLLSEYKSPQLAEKKRPWFAWVLVAIFIIFLGYTSVIKVQEFNLHKQLTKLDEQHGIVVRDIDIVSTDSVNIEILRDPLAITLETWLSENSINIKHLNVNEKRYTSLDTDILFDRAMLITKRHPTIAVDWSNAVLTLSGTLDSQSKKQLVSALKSAGFTQDKNLFTDNIALSKLSLEIPEEVINQQLFQQLVEKISAIQLDFNVKSNALSPEMTPLLKHLSSLLQQLDIISKKLNIPYGLIIIGSSDKSGNKVTNDRLSIKRAENAAEALVNLGIGKDIMYTTGIGQVDIQYIENTARKVMFNVLYISK